MKASYEIYTLYWLDLEKKQKFDDWVEKNEAWIEAHGSIIQSCLRFLKKYML